VKFFNLFLILLCLATCNAQASSLSQKTNDNPFLNGELNSEYEGQKTGLLGQIIEMSVTKENYPIYKLNLNIGDMRPIWVTSIASQPEGGIKLGDNIIFKGFIASAASLDESGELEKLIGSKMLLMAVYAQRP
jgi:hypothetical protein